MIKYVNSLNGINTDNLKGFFVGWYKPISAEKHFEILNNSNYFWLAIDSSSNNVVGFINSITDHTYSAFIPLLEVLPEYQKRGIGSELVKKMLLTLREYSMVDLVCDDKMIDFYKRFKMVEGKAMMLRNFNDN